VQLQLISDVSNIVSMFAIEQEGISNPVNTFFTVRHRLLHACQRRDCDCDDKPQRSCGHVTQPAQEGDGSWRYFLSCG